MRCERPTANETRRTTPNTPWIAPWHRCAVLAVSLFAANLARAEPVTLDSVPPVVVRSVPEAGTDGVDAATAEIKVTFSKDMADGSWSWSTASQDTFPELSGKPHYEADHRTCVLPVKLKPGHVYAIWVNSQKFGNFRDAGKRPAVPYLLIFKTKG